MENGNELKEAIILDEKRWLKDEKQVPEKLRH